MLAPAPGDPVPNSVTPGGCRGAGPVSSEKPLCLFCVATTQEMSPLVGAVVFSTDILKCDDRKPGFEGDQVFKEQSENSEMIR